jgi:hypothetical protein
MVNLWTTHKYHGRENTMEMTQDQIRDSLRQVVSEANGSQTLHMTVELIQILSEVLVTHLTIPDQSKEGIQKLCYFHLLKSVVQFTAQATGERL